MTSIRKSIVVVVTLVTAATFQLQSVSAQQPVNDRTAKLAQNAQARLAQQQAHARQQQLAESQKKVMEAAQAQLRRHVELRQRQESVPQLTKRAQSQIHSRAHDKSQEHIMSQKKVLRAAEDQLQNHVASGRRPKSVPQDVNRLGIDTASAIPPAQAGDSVRLPVNESGTVFPTGKVNPEKVDTVKFRDNFSGQTDPARGNSNVENTLFGDSVATGVHVAQGENAFARTNQTRMSARLAAVVSQRRAEISLIRDEAIEKGDRERMDMADRMEKQLKAFVWSQGKSR